MRAIPEEVRRLAAERERARRARDFATADSLRERIGEAGFEVADGPEGPVLTLRAVEGPSLLDPGQVRSVLHDPPGFDVSVQWLAEGWPEDIVRGFESFRRYQGDRSVQYVVVDAIGELDRVWPEGVEIVRLRPGMGWAAARNAGLRRAAGTVVIVVDGSVEAEGDVLGPLEATLGTPGVGLTGPFGIVTEDLREFRESEGPEVDAIEAYLMALRREVVEADVGFDERFKFYRSADIELSFQVKAKGLGVRVTPVPVRRHEHRTWANTPEGDRQRLSKRNFYRFLDRWRGRTDLLVRAPP